MGIPFEQVWSHRHTHLNITSKDWPFTLQNTPRDEPIKYRCWSREGIVEAGRSHRMDPPPYAQPFPSVSSGRLWFTHLDPDAEEQPRLLPLGIGAGGCLSQTLLLVGVGPPASQSEAEPQGETRISYCPRNTGILRTLTTLRGAWCVDGTRAVTSAPQTIPPWIRIRETGRATSQGLFFPFLLPVTGVRKSRWPLQGTEASFAGFTQLWDVLPFCLDFSSPSASKEQIPPGTFVMHLG